MAVGTASTDFKVVPGVRLASTACGIKGQDQQDLVLFEFAEGSVTAGIFTQSIFAAAPVIVGRTHLEQANSRYFLINSGNANAATGEEGVADADGCCKALSQRSGVRPEEVVPFSTGVIGEKLQVANITEALPAVLVGLSADNWLEAAKGIMTTDTRPKIGSREIGVAGKTVTLTGIAKGAGMIQPNMATMLAYLATDGRCGKDFLQTALQAGADQSFNRITVDGDTSTNDSCMLTATGVSGVDLEDAAVSLQFQAALNSLMQELAHGIIRDAEGATKFVEVRVEGGASHQDCLDIAFSIANSPLIKTALFASDANWGRIVMAIGKAGVNVDPQKIDVAIGDVALMKSGGKAPDYTEAAGAEVMAAEEIVINVNLNAGDAVESVWTSDLSHEYVSINADYRT
jgi:glutamate N-acetyltransferase/amino-acid N-acetyltransferase